MSKQQQQAAETNERRRAELEQRANELAAREAALDGAEASLAQRQAAVGEREEATAAREAGVPRREEMVAAREGTLLQREEEIRILRGECKQLAQQAVEVEEQNQALREENALAFTKIYKKLESSATSEGLQKEMLSLKEGTDNRMLVLENLMREIGATSARIRMCVPFHPDVTAVTMQGATR